MNLKSLIPIAGLAAAAFLLSRFQLTSSARPQGSSSNELPGYTFPAPGDQGVVTDAAGQVVAQDYVTGTAIQAYVNAQQIRAEHVVPPVPTYKDIQFLDTNQYMVPGGVNRALVPADALNPATGQYLAITNRSWGIYDAQGYLVRGQSGSFGGIGPVLREWGLA